MNNYAVVTDQFGTETHYADIEQARRENGEGRVVEYYNPHAAIERLYEEMRDEAAACDQAARAYEGAVGLPGDTVADMFTAAEWQPAPGNPHRRQWAELQAAQGGLQFAAQSVLDARHNNL